MTGFQMQRQLSSNTEEERINKMEKQTIVNSSLVDDFGEPKPLIEIVGKNEYKATKSFSFGSDSGAEEDLSQAENQSVSDTGKTTDDECHISSQLSMADADEDYQNHVEQEFNESSFEYSYTNDVALAATIPHLEKQNFCENTMIVFHGEFQIKFASVVKEFYPEYDYHLLPLPDCYHPTFVPGSPFAYVDNAKAQFKCPSCSKSWTSMRARISFNFSYANLVNVVFMKIYSQACQDCHFNTQPLWYMDEVCRVMDNFAKTALRHIMPQFFPQIEEIPVEYAIPVPRQRSRNGAVHNPNQRKGVMSAKHNAAYCEACRFGLCFESR